MPKAIRYFRNRHFAGNAIIVTKRREDAEAQGFAKLQERMKEPASWIHDPEDSTQLRCKTKGGNFISFPRDSEGIFERIRTLEFKGVHDADRLTHPARLCVAAHLIVLGNTVALIASSFRIGSSGLDGDLRLLALLTKQEMESVGTQTALRSLAETKRRQMR